MNIKMIGAAVLAGAVVAGCGSKNEVAEATPKADKAVFAVNGVKLMQSDIDKDIDAIMKMRGSQIPEDRKAEFREGMKGQLVQNFIVQNLLVKAAKDSKVTVTDADLKEREKLFLEQAKKNKSGPQTLEDLFKQYPFGVERARKEFENGVLIDKLFKAEMAKRPVTKEAEAEADTVIAGVISNNATAATSDATALKRIKALKAQLDKTAEKDRAKVFADLAKVNSDCPSKEKGGDLGAFGKGMMVPEFEKAAFAQKVGQISEPVKTKFGYHLIYTTKKIPAVEAKGDKPAEAEKVQASHILIKATEVQPVPKKEEVLKFIRQREERQYVQNYIQELMKKANLEALDSAFKQFEPPKDEPKPAEAKPTEAQPAEPKPALPQPVAKPARK